MSSARKRAAIHKANIEVEQMRRALRVAEGRAFIMKTAAETLARKCDELQAKIDSLMLEFCPDEMTPEQKARWERNQVATTIDVVLAEKDET